MFLNGFSFKCNSMMQKYSDKNLLHFLYQIVLKQYFVGDVKPIFGGISVHRSGEEFIKGF